ncbi:putative cuticle protein [Ixodes scapularis]
MIAQVTFALLLAYASGLATHFGGGHHSAAFPGGFGGNFGYGGGLVAAPAVLKAVAADPVYPPQPYEFGFDTVDEFGTRQTRQESGDSGNVKKGSYSYTDPNGIFRQVNYIADADGFRASIQTNEPGTQSGPVGDAVYDAKPVVVAPKAHVKAAAAYLSPTYAAPGYYGKY